MCQALVRAWDITAENRTRLLLWGLHPSGERIFTPEVNNKINKGNIGEMSAGQSWELGDGAGSTSSDGEAAGSGIRGRGRGLF